MVRCCKLVFSHNWRWFPILSAHHLVVDGISWRILLEDLALGYRQAAGGEEIQLPPKTSSFKAYTKKLSDYAESQQLMKQLKYWRETEEYQTEALPLIKSAEPEKTRENGPRFRIP